MKKILIIAATAMLFVGCGKEKFAEINTDPAAVSQPDPSFLFLTAQNNLVGGEYTVWFYSANRAALPWAQMMVGDRGSLNGSNVFDISRWDNPFWGNLYGGLGGTVKELQHVIDNLPEEKKNANQHFWHMAQIMMVQGAIFATDYNGDIPYTQALQGLYTNPPLLKPVYDTQEDLLNTLDTELKAAIAVLGDADLMSKQTSIKSVQEPVYSGKPEKWIKFANALRLKIALRLLHANPTKAKAIAQEVATDGRYMSSNDDDYRAVTDKYSNGPGSGTWPGTPAKGFMNFLKANKDPRVRFLFSKNPYNPGVIQGMLDEDITFPDYIADEMVVTDGKFIRWKSKEMGDGEQYLGEPWVRYQGIPVTQDGYLTSEEKEKYTVASKFRITLSNGAVREFLPYSQINWLMISPRDNQVYPSIKPAQDEYKPNGQYNYTIVTVGAAETLTTLALFEAQGGVDVPGKTANELFQEGVKCSVRAYDKSAKHHNILYYDSVYDNTTFKNAENKDEVIEKAVKLNEEELTELLTRPAYTLTGNASTDVEKCFIQLAINTFMYPGEVYFYSRQGGIPKTGSTVWARDLFTNNSTTEAALNIPRHLKFDEPNKSDMNYQNRVEAFQRQGFTNYSAASPIMSEKLWYDKDAPEWGAGPKIR